MRARTRIVQAVINFSCFFHVPACARRRRGRRSMRIFERATPSAAWRLLSAGSLAFLDAQALLRRMEEHVASDGRVHGLCVDFENTRTLISDARELYIVATLAAAYNNSLTAQQLQHETDLYGDAYTQNWPTRLHQASSCPRLGAREPTCALVDDVVAQGPESSFTLVPNRRTKTEKRTSDTDAACKGVSRHTRQEALEEWDAELKGDRFIYDPTYEQNEELLPWNVRDSEERFGWYM